LFVLFFFQAEDGIRDLYVTGVQTCALPIFPVVTEDLLRKLAHNEEHLAILRSVGLHSVMTVPMVVSGRTIAALTLASAESGREYGEDDLRFAEELARRAALAMENSRLYQEARHESDERKRALEVVRDLNE